VEAEPDITMPELAATVINLPLTKGAAAAFSASSFGGTSLLPTDRRRE